MQLTPHDGGARALLTATLPDPGIGLAWLGQAGFFIRHARHRLLIDPYLSDHLARKHEDREFSHARMMPSPVEADAFRDLDLVLCTHRHGDHLDPGSLPTLARNNPRCRFVVPRAELACAMAAGPAEPQLIPANAGDRISIDESLQINVIASAHENFQINDRGEHHFLGYILRFGGMTLYHSGDTLVYDGLAQQLRRQRIDAALLPVNGRSEHLAARGIAGNMTFDEARDLCLAAAIGLMVPHHFGMFAFNTADPTRLRDQIAGLDARRLRCVLPEADRYYVLA